MSGLTFFSFIYHFSSEQQVLKIIQMASRACRHTGRFNPKLSLSFLLTVPLLTFTSTFIKDVLMETTNVRYSTSYNQR